MWRHWHCCFTLWASPRSQVPFSHKKFLIYPRKQQTYQVILRMKEECFQECWPRLSQVWEQKFTFALPGGCKNKFIKGLWLPVLEEELGVKGQELRLLPLLPSPPLRSPFILIDSPLCQCTEHLGNNAELGLDHIALCNTNFHDKSGPTYLKQHTWNVLLFLCFSSSTVRTE